MVKTSQKIKLKLFGQMYACLFFCLHIRAGNNNCYYQGYKNKNHSFKADINKQLVNVLKNKVSDEGCLYKRFPHSTHKVYLRKHLSGQVFLFCFPGTLLKKTKWEEPQTVSTSGPVGIAKSLDGTNILKIYTSKIGGKICTKLALWFRFTLSG